MSADNWAVCPLCLRAAIEEYDRRSAEIAASYGKVPVAQFDSDREALGVRPTADSLEPTLREDYEMGMLVDGEFVVGYTAACSSCSFNHDFKHSEKLLAVTE